MKNLEKKQQEEKKRKPMLETKLESCQTKKKNNEKGQTKRSSQIEDRVPRRKNTT